MNREEFIGPGFFVPPKMEETALMDPGLRRTRGAGGNAEEGRKIGLVRTLPSGFDSMRRRWIHVTALAAWLSLLPAAPCRASERMVTDQLGRTMRVPAEPARIVSLAPSITEILFALGQEDRLMGVTQFSDFPPRAGRLPKVGSYVHLDLERIVALKPDLCIAIKDGNPREMAERLETLRIPVYAVDPRDLRSVMGSIREVGRLLNTEKKAVEVTERMGRRIDAVKARIARTGERPGVFFQIGISPIVAVGTDTFIHELIVLAGGRNLSAGPTPYPRFSVEQVLALSPEVFIITSMAREGAFDRVKEQWSRWPRMPAVKNGRIHLVDSNIFDRPSPRLVDGLEVLARLIHPDLFGDAR